MNSLLWTILFSLLPGFLMSILLYLGGLAFYMTLGLLLYVLPLAVQRRQKRRWKRREGK